MTTPSTNKRVGTVFDEMFSIEGVWCIYEMYNDLVAVAKSIHTDPIKTLRTMVSDDLVCYWPRNTTLPQAIEMWGRRDEEIEHPEGEKS